jgi:hypothetical protein
MTPPRRTTLVGLWLDRTLGSAVRRDRPRPLRGFAQEPHWQHILISSAEEVSNNRRPDRRAGSPRPRIVYPPD